METSQIIALSSSLLVTIVGTVFTESIKEVIKKYFALKTKKQVTKAYRIILIVAITIPLLFVFIDSKKKSTTEIIDRTNTIQPINN